mgnify:CR=1 FL=1
MKQIKIWYINEIINLGVGAVLDTSKLLRKAYLLAAEKSQDPVTKNGAILINQNNIV